MQLVNFIFRPGVPLENQEALLERIGQWSEVVKTARLKPGARHPNLQRMCHLYLKEGADVQSTLKKMQKLPEIESASVPAARQLI